MTRLPINAQEFFTPNKPKQYLYFEGKAENRVVSGRQTGVIVREDMTDKPAHQVQPHQQPRIKVRIVPPTPRPIPQNHQPQQIQQHTEVQQTTPVVQSSQPVTAVKIQKVSGNAPVQHATKTPIPTCIYLIRTPSTSGCGCNAGRQCSNPACPLSRDTRSGKKIQLNVNTCRQENCRWFTPK